MTHEELSEAVARQLNDWPLARRNHDALSGLLTRRMEVDGFTWTLQHNPARAVSTAAPVDAASIAARPCFLCATNRPPEQHALAAIEGFEVLVNPFPIFPLHLTIAATAHTPQRIGGVASSFVESAALLSGMTVFYNGACCGASAPDHLHFQAVPTDLLPIWLSDDANRPVRHLHADYLSAPEAIRFITEGAARWTDDRINAYVRATPAAILYDNSTPSTALSSTFDVIIVPRRAHRPALYGSAPGQYLISPGAIDMAGTLILPRHTDFLTLTPTTLRQILTEVAY